ncbi:MAG TPA: nitroreductase [Bacteroidia bacterium]|nr:nitroreductase [Bacteroidia bacterium]
MAKETKKIISQPNETLQIIYDRRSVRKFKDTVVGQILIEQILDAGRMAPSALNKQPWKFYVVTDKELIRTMSKQITKVSVKQIAKIGLKEIVKSIWHYIHSPHDLNFLNQSDFIFHDAPVLIFITAPKDNEWASLDIGMCCQNIMLAAKSLGLDSCPIGLAKFIEETKAVSRLGLSKNETVHLAVLLGYGNESPGVKERKKDNVVYVN